MNRGTVILLALAILIAHTFAIHQTPSGDFAEPYDLAHVAFRLGRNLVFEGSAMWNPTGPPAESYPSALWILASALAARLYVSPILVAQILGLGAAIGTVILLAQFSPKRISGMIAPLLLAASGSVAAASMSGTEANLAMFLLTTSFLAFERGMGRLLGASLACLCLTRPEGAVAAGFLLAMEARWRPLGAHGRRPPRWRSYVASALCLALMLAARRALTGQWLSPFFADLLEFRGESARLGGWYFASFVVSSGFGLLFLAVVLSLAAARVSALGARALTLASGWWFVVVLSGGDGLPFWNALVPGLPLFFLGLQECLREWMDERAATARVVWPLLGVTVVTAFLVSKVPGDLGPLPLEAPLTRWQTPSAPLAAAYPRPLGRLGLLEEIRAVEHLRTLGVFLRDRVRPDATILTAWPGAIGYLSRKEVLDLGGRAWPLEGEQRSASWRGVRRVDLVQLVAKGVDYIVPVIGSLSATDAPVDFLHTWLERYDTVGPTEKRVRELLRALQGFMLTSVPVPVASRRPNDPSETPFPLLQRRELERIPTLELKRDSGELRVLVHHVGNPLVLDLCVRATLENGEERYLRPTGSWATGMPLDARTSLLVFPSPAYRVELLSGTLPPELARAEITAWLHNPGMRPEAPLSLVGAPVTVK